MTETPEPIDTTPADEHEPAQTDTSEEPQLDAAVEAEPNNEAAKYRRQLRTVEGERDTLRDRLDARDRADVERMVQHRLTDPSDIWRGDVTLEQLRGEGGELDPALVDAAAKAVTAQHPHWATGTGPAAPSSAVTMGATKPDMSAEEPAWQGVFRQALGQRRT